ncbi:unnamed protein product, partial [Oncorhynchus mykiss]
AVHLCEVSTVYCLAVRLCEVSTVYCLAVHLCEVSTVYCLAVRLCEVSTVYCLAVHLCEYTVFQVWGSSSHLDFSLVCLIDSSEIWRVRQMVSPLGEPRPHRPSAWGYRQTSSAPSPAPLTAASPLKEAPPLSPPPPETSYSPVVQSKFERPCCSPKYGSPKLQRKLSTSSKADLQGGASSSTAGPRAPTPTTPQKGASESAWARSTTTRDSPVHTTINDGLSCLFNIIDHSPVAYEPPQCKFTKSPSRSRPTPLDPSPPGEPGLPTSDLKDPRYLGAVQEFLRNVRGRSPSPVQLIVETQGGPGGTGGERTPEVLSIRQDLSAPPGYTLAENAARLLNKKLLEQSFREEKRLGSGGSSAQGQGGYTREGRQAEGDRNQSGCLELTRNPAKPCDKPSNRQSTNTGLRLNPTTLAPTLVGCGRACKLLQTTKGSTAASCPVTRAYQTS